MPSSRPQAECTARGPRNAGLFSLPRYLAINAGVALASAPAAFGVAMMIPALLRYWRSPVES